jgi:hypothetical protein
VKIQTKRYKQNGHRPCLQVFVDGQVLGQIVIQRNYCLIDRFQGIDSVCQNANSAIKKLVKVRLQEKDL